MSEPSIDQQFSDFLSLPFLLRRAYLLPFILNSFFLLTILPGSERKIDRIEDRLAGIENVLESLAQKLGSLDLKGSPSDSSTRQSKSSRVGKSPSSITEVNAPSPAPFEGETTLNSQSEVVRGYLERAVVNTPSIGSNSQVQAALATLQNMARRQNQVQPMVPDVQLFQHKAPSDVDMSQFKRPPWDAVIDLLERATGMVPC
jgi:hypothetical protein